MTALMRKEPSSRRAHRGPVEMVREFLMNVTAIGGTVCIACLLLAVVFDITLVLFKTGSMSPTIPAGSLAVVREIPAEEIEVGDVVTVNRVDMLPVTHRVTSVTDTGGPARTITMKGDANLTEDPAPYVVETVRLVLWSAPDLAHAIMRISTPTALAGITVAVAALVTWGSWPTPEPGQQARARRRTKDHTPAGPEA